MRKSISLCNVIAVLLSVSVASSWSAMADTPGSIAKGRIYAQDVCANCHDIRQGRFDSPNAKATPFQDIADVGGMTRTALFVFFRTPHKSMPNLIIDGENADNVIAYILSLKGKK